LDTKLPALTANKLLAALPRDDFKFLQDHFRIVALAQNSTLFDVDDEVEQVYFPLSGMVSLLVVLKDGNAIETATVGREGVAGAMAGLGLHRSRVRAVIQLSGVVAHIPAPQFRKITAASKGVSNLCVSYNETLLAQARITAACNIAHHVEARFCRWLLQSRDRAESDTVPLTQVPFGNAWRAPYVSYRGCRQDAERGRHQLYPWHHQNCRSGQAQETVLRML
jgi:CRP-like cAMP-binding protein